MIERLALSLAQRIKGAIPHHPASVDVLAFSLSVLINTGSIILISIIIGAVLGNLWSVVIAMVSFALLRQISGGYHLKSGVLCVVVSVAGITAISWVDMPRVAVIVVTLVSAVFALIFAPSRIENQTRIPSRFYPHLKVGSAILIALNLLIQSPVIAAAYFVQVLTLIHGKGVKRE